MDEKPKKVTEATFVVAGEQPLQAMAPTFSNFVGVSHVGSEVQFEFIFLDINVVAKHLIQKESEQEATLPAEKSAPTHVQGKTVAKIIMPVSSFVQLKGHFEKLFEKLETAGRGKEKIDERARSSG